MEQRLLRPNQVRHLLITASVASWLKKNLFFFKTSCALFIGRGKTSFKKKYQVNTFPLDYPLFPIYIHSRRKKKKAHLIPDTYSLNLFFSLSQLLVHYLLSRLEEKWRDFLLETSLSKSRNSQLIFYAGDINYFKRSLHRRERKKRAPNYKRCISK